MTDRCAVQHTDVELARIDDIPALIPLLREFGVHVSQKYPIYPTSDEVAERILLGLLSAHPVFVARREGEVIGSIAGLLTPHLFNPAIEVLTEIFWWVKPACRGSRAGLLLLEALTSWGRQHADIVILSLEHDSPVNPKSLEKRGFQARESNYILEV